MKMEEAKRLQAAIDREIVERSLLIRIALDHGSEFTQLASNADVRVTVPGQLGDRTFTVVTSEALHQWLNDSSYTPDPTWDSRVIRSDRYIYTTGGPLCIVREVDACSIVGAVCKYLLQEGFSQEQLRRTTM